MIRLTVTKEELEVLISALNLASSFSLSTNNSLNKFREELKSIYKEVSDAQ